MKQPIYPTAVFAVWALIGWSISPLALIFPDAAQMSEARADELSDLIRDDQTGEIAETARGEIARSAADRSFSHLLRLGRWLHLNDNPSLAAECYEAVLDAVPAQKLPESKQLIVYRLAASIRLDLGEREAADALLTSAIAISKESDGKTAAMLHDLALDYLRDEQFDAAVRLFGLAADHLDAAAAVANELGLAWAMASRQTDHVEAASRLEGFASQYPDHRDAANAIRKANQCYAHQLDSISIEQLADQTLTIKGWIRTGGTPDRARHWINQFRDETPTELAVAWAQQLLNLATSFQNIDSQTQKHLDTTASIRELAANWLARQGKWEIIAATAESEIAILEVPNAGKSSEPFPSETRTTGLERWFAESLMQVGRIDRALVWWNHLLENRGAVDFASLLRCAEAETSAGNSIGKANDRIERARGAIEGDPRRQSLVDLLDAQLKIRSAEFDRSRQMLSEVLSRDHQDSEIADRVQDSEIVARAQWLIGETFYLGRRYEEAIEAYRKVENLAPTSEYAAAALIQAGKSFEQLGRTRQASICYGHLLSRFDKSPHAEPARKRLARMEPMPPHVASRPQTDTPNSIPSQR